MTQVSGPAVRERLRSVPWHLVALGYAVVVVIVPLRLTMPAAGLDNSWAFALNRAIAGHLAFGRDVVFTYGPYAPVSTRLYEPGLATLTLVGGVLIAAGMLVALVPLVQAVPGRRQVGVALAIAVAVLAVASPDLVLVVYPLLVLARTIRLDDLSVAPNCLVQVATMAVGLAMLPLVKLSALPLSIAALVLATASLARRRQHRAAGVLPGTALLSVPILWVCAGQPIGAIPSYLHTGVWVISGYTDALSSAPLPSAALAALVLAGVLVSVAPLLATRLTADHVLLAAMIALTVFTAFRPASMGQSLVRMLMYVVVLVIVVLVAAPVMDRHWVLRTSAGVVVATLVLAELVGFGQGHELIGKTVANAGRNGWQPVLAGARRIVDPGGLHADYDKALADIRRLPLPTPARHRTTDVYGVEQSIVLAHDSPWSPRPMLQSYVAYTPQLAALDRAHLEGAHAPDELLVQLHPIFGQLPSLADGPSFLPMLTDYRSLGGDVATNFVHLGRRRTPLDLHVGATRLVRRGRVGGALVRVPRASGWLARIDVKKSAWGRLRSLVYPSPKLYIDVLTQDGTVHTYRFIASMGESQFLLSPFLVNTGALAALVDPTVLFVPPRVRAVGIHTEGRSHAYRSDYFVELTSVDLAPLGTRGAVGRR